MKIHLYNHPGSCVLSPISRNNTAFWRAAARQEIYMEFLKNPLERGSGQPVTCPTSGICLRLKWISIEMCLVLSLSMASWTTISLIRRFRMETSSSVMYRYSCMDSTHCLASTASRFCEC